MALRPQDLAPEAVGGGSLMMPGWHRRPRRGGAGAGVPLTSGRGSVSCRLRVRGSTACLKTNFSLLPKLGGAGLLQKNNDPILSVFRGKEEAFGFLLSLLLPFRLSLMEY